MFAPNEYHNPSHLHFFEINILRLLLSKGGINCIYFCAYSLSLWYKLPGRRCTFITSFACSTESTTGFCHMVF